MVDTEDLEKLYLEILHIRPGADKLYFQRENVLYLIEKLIEKSEEDDKS